MSKKKSFIQTFEADVEKVSGFESNVSMREFNITIDEPENFGGTNEGASPVEVLLGSLGGCINVVASMVAKEMGFELEDLKLKVEGDLDPRGFKRTADVPAGFQEVRVKIQKLEGIPDEKRAEYIEEIEGRCPLEDTIQRNVEVKFE